MPLPSRIGQRALIAYALAGAILAVICLAHADPNAGIPPYRTLMLQQGTLAWAKTHKYGINFALNGDKKVFNYPSKARSVGKIEAALVSSGAAPITVRYDPKPFGPVLSGATYYDVWELAVGPSMIQRYQQTSANWASDNRLASWLGGVFLLSSAILSIQAWRQRKNVW